MGDKAPAGALAKLCQRSHRSEAYLEGCGGPHILRGVGCQSDVLVLNCIDSGSGSYDSRHKIAYPHAARVGKCCGWLWLTDLRSVLTPTIFPQNISQRHPDAASFPFRSLVISQEQL